MLVLAFTDGENPKRYITKQSAYYAIAKRLVVEKYPPMLGNAYGTHDPTILGEEWTDKLVEVRTKKMFDLFYVENADGYFDDRLWRRFVTRVAKFLMFVDSKRNADRFKQHETKTLWTAYVNCEKALEKMAQQITDIKRELDAREKEAGHR